MVADPAEFVTVPAAARARNLDPRQLKRAIRRRELRAFDFGGWPRVRLEDVDCWIESSATTSPTPSTPPTLAQRHFLDELAAAVAERVLRELRQEPGG